MRNILKTILAILAKLTLARYKPKIVGITGSVGKTSTKEAVALVLGKKFKIRQSPENYNNEIGLPLSIIGEYSAGKNPLGWFLVIIKALVKLIRTDYPEILVLEMGSDRPGDIGYLLGLVGKMDIVVISDIGISHLEFFTHPGALAKEKLSILKRLSKQGTAVINYDSQKAREGISQVKTKAMSYGFDPNASLYASDFHLLKQDDSWGANFKVHFEGTVVPFFLPKALGQPAVYAALGAAAVGISFGLNMVEVSESLRKFKPPPGRLHLIAGIKQTSILDDSYNSAPSSTLAALEALKSVGRGRLIAVLGDMSELGQALEEGHRLIGRKIGEIGVDCAFLIGDNIKFTQDELSKRKYGGKIFVFQNSELARIPVQDFLLPGDTILVKGSQSTRMEKIVKEIMADPLEASELLVRQSKTWLDKP